MDKAKPGQVTALIHVPEGVSVTKQDYPTASWYVQLDLTPGTYELKADSRHGLTYMNWGSVPGVVTKAHFPSGFGGMYYHNEHQDRYIGTVEHYIIFRYDYNLKDETLKNGIRIEKLDLT